MLPIPWSELSMNPPPTAAIVETGWKAGWSCLQNPAAGLVFVWVNWFRSLLEKSLFIPARLSHRIFAGALIFTWVGDYWIYVDDFTLISFVPLFHPYISERQITIFEGFQFTVACGIASTKFAHRKARINGGLSPNNNLFIIVHLTQESPWISGDRSMSIIAEQWQPKSKPRFAFY